jgi:Ca2+-binding RTX toxin-like protein
MPRLALLPVTFLVAAVALAAAPAAQAAFPGHNGRIAARGPATFGLFTFAPDGSDPRALTGSQDQDGGVSWSADGRRLAFHRAAGPGTNVYVMNADGSGLVQLTYNGRSMEPAFSPDGKTIAFVLFDEEGTSSHDVYAMDADGSNVRELTTEHGWDPSYSADGSRIVFETNRGNRFNIAIMNADGSDERVLTSAYSTAPDFSPDGARIVYSGANAVHVMNADGSGDVTLTGTPDVYDQMPAFSPDGSTIAFFRYDSRVEGPDATNLVAMDADGSDQRVLRGDASAVDWQPLDTPYVPPAESPPAPPGNPPAPPAPTCSAARSGTSAGNWLTGTSGGDLLRGLAGNDRLSGGGGSDCLYGGIGDDLLSGGSGNDRLDGFRGNDVLKGGGGRDRFEGGTGSDRVNSRDGVPETVDCGPNRDVAVVDERDSVHRCERVLE